MDCCCQLIYLYFAQCGVFFSSFKANRFVNLPSPYPIHEYIIMLTKRKSCSPHSLRGTINEKTITKQELTSSPFPASKSIGPFTTGFTDDPTPRKPHILTNYKAYQPCCCGSTRHFYRRFQLQKSCSGSWEHFQGYPMLSRGENSIQKELQSDYTWQSIRKFLRETNPTKKLFLWKGRWGRLLFSPSFLDLCILLWNLQSVAVICVHSPYT